MGMQVLCELSLDEEPGSASIAAEEAVSYTANPNAARGPRVQLVRTRRLGPPGWFNIKAGFAIYPAD
jgi:hypothetical protein